MTVLHPMVSRTHKVLFLNSHEHFVNNLTLSNFFCSISTLEFLLHKFNNQILFALCYILTYTNLHLFVDKYVGP